MLFQYFYTFSPPIFSIKGDIFYLIWHRITQTSLVCISEGINLVFSPRTPFLVVLNLFMKGWDVAADYN